MRLFLQILCFVLLLVLFIGAAEALNYTYLSDIEMTTFGDRIRFMREDSICGIIRTNGQFAFFEDFVPPCCLVIMGDAGSNFESNPDCPQNYMPNILPTVIPIDPSGLRNSALVNGTFYDQGEMDQATIHIVGDELLVWWGELGQPVDTTVAPTAIVVNPDQPVHYFDCMLRVSGTLSSSLILIGVSKVGLEDNILYASSDPVTGALTENHPEKFALVSLGDIKILNNPANGRLNSNGLGQDQTNPDSTSIALNGFYFALGSYWADAAGSFTFENQNDCVDSGYCGPSPDERGKMYLWGGITQRRRGYLHRSNNGGTGYIRRWHWDEELADWDIGVFDEDHFADPDTVFFGDVPVGSIARDTVELNLFDYSTLGAVIASQPFDAERIEPFFGTHFHVPVSFEPIQSGNYSGMLNISTTYQFFLIPLYGHAVPGNGPVFEPSVFPNPFNNTAMISFRLETASDVRVTLYDILGRHVSTLLDEHRLAGIQQVQINGQALASGVYFARLETPAFGRTIKVLLLK